MEIDKVGGREGVKTDLFFLPQSENLQIIMRDQGFIKFKDY